MKYRKKGILLILAGVFSIASVQAQKTLHSKLDSMSYALGVNIAMQLRDQGLDTLSYEAVKNGMRHILQESDSQEFTQEQANMIIKSYLQNMAQQQARENLLEGELFLSRNAQRPEVHTTASGLQYEVIKEGDGPQPGPGDRVKVHYTGKLIDGKVFDSSIERDKPATFGVTQVIKGWTEALQMMKVGSVWMLYIPSNLAYGPNGRPGIPPNAVLVFEVRLLEVVGKPTPAIEKGTSE